MPPADLSTIIVCIGNELIADDAAGFEVYQRLAGIDARLEYCGVGGIDLLSLIDGETDMIVVDAVQFGSAPGTVHVIPWEELPRASTEISAHGLGLRETIEIGRILSPEKMPERITLIGIEGRCFNRTRDGMTREVFESIDNAVAHVKKLCAEG